MRMIRPEQLKHLRETYPTGTRVELVQMDDAQAPPIGTKAPSPVWTTQAASWSTGTTAPA